MVYYYEQKEPIFHALLVIFKQTTIFGLVLKRPEFWLFLGGHCTAMALFKVGIWESGELGSLSATWEAVSTTQMFMVFLLTFYNGHCYDRYLRLYSLCMDALDGAIFFVQEVVISLAPPSVENHRVKVVKYIVAMLHIFFVGLTGRMKSKADWREMVNRGLLTKMEAEQLQQYPSQSIETVLVVATWAMQIVDKGLEDDAFWHQRSMRIAHTHNRLQTYLTQMLASMHAIGDELGCPIPFPLYHLMNVVLIFNLFLLCTLTAVFKTYQTVFPLMISLMFFLGLREVAGNLSDPFQARGLGSDFPINAFVTFAFDTSVCLLEAFRHGDPEEFIRGLVSRTSEFTNEQLRHITPMHVIYKPKYDATRACPFSWHQEMPMTTMEGSKQGPETMLSVFTMVPSSGMPIIVEEPEIRPRKKKDGPKKPGFFARLMKKKPKKDLASMTKADLWADAEYRLEKNQKRNARVEAEITHWNKEIDDLKTLLEHRLQVGRDLNLPVDEAVAKALLKVEIEPKKQKGLVPEFTSFSEAQSILAHVATQAI